MLEQCKYKVFFLDMFARAWLIQQGVAEILLFLFLTALLSLLSFFPPSFLAKTYFCG